MVAFSILCALPFRQAFKHQYVIIGLSCYFIFQLFNFIFHAIFITKQLLLYTVNLL
ncbi:hypothetical protein HMPREF3203_00138 [Proteus mirabilis]|nr:hypothetical protein HMPREF3203_00138 [Proteus mirabilis]